MSDNLYRLFLSPGSILNGRYSVVREISDGTFTNVYECNDLVEHLRVAIKCYRAAEEYDESADEERTIAQCLNRADKLGNLFVKYYGSFVHKRHQCLIFEYLGPSLFTVLETTDFRPMPLRAARDVMWRISKAVEIVHKCGFIHTDIKLDNVLVNSAFEVHRRKLYREEDNQLRLVEDLNQDFCVRLIDFGSFANHRMWNHHLGTTRRYRAPEIIMGLRWGHECDIWSLGCIFLELIIGIIPFDSRDDLLKLFLIQHSVGPFSKWMREECLDSKIQSAFKGHLIDPLIFDRDTREKAMRVKLIEKYLPDDPDLIDLILGTLQTDPFNRYCTSQVSNHRFFNRH